MKQKLIKTYGKGNSVRRVKTTRRTWGRTEKIRSHNNEKAHETKIDLNKYLRI